SAPSLDEYLGEVGKISLSFLAERSARLKAVPGVSKYIIPCNWKFAADNTWDYYHGITHQSSQMAGYNSAGGRRGPVGSRSFFARPQITMLGDYGHAIGGPQYDPDAPVGNHPDFSEDWRERPEAKEALGPAGLKIHGHPHIFPNMWITQFGQVSMRMPK